MYEIKLYKSKWKAIKLLILSLPFVLFGVLDLIHHSKIVSIWLDWVCIGFFGLGIPIGLFNLLDNTPEIIFDDKGITKCQFNGVFNKNDKGFVNWDSITNVYLHINQQYSPQGIPTSKQKFLCLALNDETRNLNNYKTGKLSKILGLSDFNISLMNMSINDDKFITFIKAMINADNSTRQNLLSSTEL